MQLLSPKSAPYILDNFDLIEKVDAATYTCDASGLITYYNKAAASLWGREPVLGKDFWCGSWKIYNPDGTPMLLGECPMAITLKEGRDVNGTLIIVECPDGSRHYVEPHPKALFDAEGNVVGAINMLIDVTEKKVAERLIQESETKYRLLADSLERMVAERTSSLLEKNEQLRKGEDRYHKMVDEVQDYAILLLDKNGTILNWNKGAEKIKGYKESEVIGKNFSIFYLAEDRQSKLPEKLISEASVNGKALHEGWRRRKDGTAFWGSIVITALHDEQNNVIGFSKVTRDLTDRKLSEDRIKQYSKELEFQNKELEQFAFAASHDLQEPLRKIQTFAELTRDNLDNEILAKRYLEKINSAASRMSSLIKDVLSYSRLSKNNEEFMEVDLNEILKNVKEDFEVIIDGRGVTFNHLSLPVVHGNPSQLRQLFSNLMSNSIKFCEDKPRISISFETALTTEVEDYPELDSTKTYFKTIFKDNGVGFEQQYARDIFKLFQRLNNNQTGTGIGLSLCKKIIENHHGYIFATSEPGKGTTFTFYLPA